MRTRTKGMWWGCTIEAPDPDALASFYSELLGWPIGHQEPGTAILAAPEGSIYIVFQEATGYRAPVWPPVDEGQRPMMHLDFQVGDLGDRNARRGTVPGGRGTLYHHFEMNYTRINTESGRRLARR